MASAGRIPIATLRGFGARQHGSAVVFRGARAVRVGPVEAACSIVRQFGIRVEEPVVFADTNNFVGGLLRH
jgi:hypothetical protein